MLYCIAKAGSVQFNRTNVVLKLDCKHLATYSYIVLDVLHRQGYPHPGRLNSINSNKKQLGNKPLPSKKTSQKRRSWGMLVRFPKVSGRRNFRVCGLFWHQASSKSRAFSSSWATALALRFLKRWRAKMPWPQESLLCAGSGGWLSQQ